MESERESEKEQIEEEEEEEVALVLQTTKVVEYLAPIMSVELLCKFPDNSAYDFDYSQSTIWSPLVPRPYSPMDLNLITPKKLSFHKGKGLGPKCSVKKLASKLRKKLTSSSFNLNLDFNNKHKKIKKRPSDFSPTPSRTKGACKPIIKQWAKALKAASRKFKRWKVKRDPVAHVMLPKSFKDRHF